MPLKEREGYKPEQIRNEAFAYVDLTKRQQQVLEVIRKWQPISNEGIARILNRPIHWITPRVLELRGEELGLVKWAGEGQSQISKRKVSLWMINPDGKQIDLF